ncbi:hypothetical protein, partial [Escherichia coli]|uniref:hypothetical protein n=1 Tax=Escherichia coli TaxID=562 RepID=UPI00200EEEDC
TPDYGFVKTDDGWSIPDMEAAYQEAAEAFRKKQASASLGGKRSAETRRQAARSNAATSAPASTPRPAPVRSAVPPAVSSADGGDF